MFKAKINLDALGISASLACAIHCALLPLFFTSLPVLGFELINNFVFETVMIVAAMLIGTYSLYHGWKKHHHKKLPMLIFLIGVACLFCKQIWHEYQFPFLIPAVIFIVFAHWLNFRYCKKANHCHAQDCDHK
jgi:hypothetical protein